MYTSPIISSLRLFLSPMEIVAMLALVAACGNIDRTLMDTPYAPTDTDTDTKAVTDTEDGQGWDTTECPNTVVPTGGPLHVGDVAPDFTLLNQYGEFVNLYDFCHKTVLIDFIAASSPSCIQEAPITQQWYEEYKGDGFIVLAVLTEGWFTGDFGGSQPNLNDLTTWAELAGATHPVLSDPDALNYLIWETEEEAAQPGYSWPRKRLLSPGMVIEAMYPDPNTTLGTSDIEDALGL